MPYPGANAVYRALAVLKAFTDGQPTWTLTGLANHLRLSKPTAHRLLGVLEQEGFLVREAGGADYRLGPEMIILGARALKSVNLRALAHVELQSLARETRDGAALEVLVGHEVLVLDEVRGKNRLSFDGEVGTRWPAHASSTGKEALSEALDQIRRRGYGINIEETELGYASVAAPVRDRDGRAVAATMIGGSARRVNEKTIPAYAEMVCQAAARISQRLGFSGKEAAQ